MVLAQALAHTSRVLALEECPMRHLLSGSWPAESTCGVLKRRVFWWLNKLFLKGYKEELRLGDLYWLDDPFVPDTLLADIQATLDSGDIVQVGNISCWRWRVNVSEQRQCGHAGRCDEQRWRKGGRGDAPGAP